MQNHYNILEIRNLYNLTQTDFAKQVKMSRELVSKIENGKTPLNKPTIKKIKSFLENNPLNNYSQDVIIYQYNSQNNAKPKETIPYLLQRREDKKTTNPVLIPLIGIKAQAGYVKNFEQVDEYVDTLDKYSLPPGVNPMGAVWSYFEVDGDSMEPTLYAGDIILASMMPTEDWHDVKNFCVYIILTADQLLVKRVFRKNDKEWVLISDNEELYEQKVIKVQDVRQVWTFRRHIRSRVPQPKEFKITA